MMAVMKNEVVEPAFPLGPATASPAEQHRVRDLNERELDEVVGGAIWVAPVVNAIYGAAVGVGTYSAVNASTGNQSTVSGYIGAAVLGAVTSPMGSLGQSLLINSITKGTRGAHVLGATLMGGAAALSIAAAAGSAMAEE
jgi:hypothetical protein